MHRLFLLTLPGALLLGCTHDFDQFSPVSSAPTTSTTSGAGGATTTSGAGGSGGRATGGHGTGGTGTAGHGTGGTGTGGHGTGGALPDAGGTENCTNGVDDDGNGLVDCADPACTAGYTCAPKLPAAGWSGPAWLFDGATAQAPGCGGAFPQIGYEGHRDLSAVPALCGKCQCDPPSGTCTVSQLISYSDGVCNQNGQSMQQPQPGQCGVLGIGANAGSYQAAAPSFVPGPCAPQQGGISKPAPTWGTTGVACVGPTSTGGCGGGGVCAARPAAPFGASLCIWTGGSVACPADYPVSHSFYDGATDNRDCTKCTCGDASGSCSAVTTIYGAKGNCNDTLGQVPNDGACHPVQGGERVRVEATTTGSCPPSTSQPVGSVVAGPGQTTVCCAK